MVVVALGFGVVIGVVVGLLGAGGSILTVPVLMLALGFAATDATGTALVVVLVVACAGLVGHAVAGRVDVRSGLAFAGAGVPAAVLGGRLSVLLPDLVLTIVLALLLLATGAWMWWREPVSHPPRPVRWSRAVLAGLGVGILTGLLGVGGGFAVVPALSGLVGLPVPVAIGTSQLVLVVNALAGLLGRVGAGTVDLTVGLTFGAGGVVGSLAATRLVGRLAPALLTRLFAGLLGVVALLLLLDAILD